MGTGLVLSVDAALFVEVEPVEFLVFPDVFPEVTLASLAATAAFGLLLLGLALGPATVFSFGRDVKNAPRTSS
jgi:hypothetical protein